MKQTLWLLTMLMLSPAAWGSMILDRSIIEFSASGGSRQDVMVTNPGEDTLFVEVSVLTVDDPGTDNERREEVRDPTSIGFIATPNRLAVPPGGRRLVRLVNLEGHGEYEQVYRVNLTPVEAPWESRDQRPQMGVRVLVGYQLLVFIAPQTVNRDLQVERQDQKLVFSNQGNVNVLLSEGRLCPRELRDSEDDRCEDIAGRRLYPGNRWQVPVSQQQHLHLRVESGEQRQREWFE